MARPPYSPATRSGGTSTCCRNAPSLALSKRHCQDQKACAISWRYGGCCAGHFLPGSSVVVLADHRKAINVRCPGEPRCDRTEQTQSSQYRLHDACSAVNGRKWPHLRPARPPQRLLGRRRESWRHKWSVSGGLVGRITISVNGMTEPSRAPAIIPRWTDRSRF
jgi:hypothetical protein